MYLFQNCLSDLINFHTNKYLPFVSNPKRSVNCEILEAGLVECQINLKTKSKKTKFNPNFKMPFEEPLAFNVEWFDLSASLHRQFLLTFYESDSSVEMSEIKTRKMFLRRCPVPSSGLDKKDLFVGNTVVVFARHLLIKDYSNEYTRNQVENHKQTTLILLYPEHIKT